MQVTTSTFVDDQFVSMINDQSLSIIVKSEMKADEKVVSVVVVLHLLFRKETNAKKRSFER